MLKLLLILLLPYYLAYNNKNKNYLFSTYILAAPIFISLIYHFKKYYNLNRLITILISYNMVFVYSYLTKKYNYSKNEWIIYYIRLILLHSYIYTMIDLLNIKY